MKKSIILLLFFLCPQICSGGEVRGLFGINLFDDLLDHYSVDYLNGKKYKHQETIDGYFSIDLDDFRGLSAGKC